MAMIALSILAGCHHARRHTQPEIEVISAVNSLAAPDAGSKPRFVLLPGGSDNPENQLQFKEYARYIEKILLSRGFQKATSIADADVAIFLSYGIGGPETRQYTYQMPVWGQTGVSSSNTYGTVSSYGSGYSTFSGTTTYTPTYGITGYSTHIRSQTTFTRFMLLDAYDVATYKHKKKMLQLWRTDVVSVGKSNDLRVVFPYMAVAMEEYVATDTRGKVPVKIRQSDPEVESLLSIEANDGQSDISQAPPNTSGTNTAPQHVLYQQPFVKGRDY